MKASAGRAEKGDALVIVSRTASDGSQVVINSPVRVLFGRNQDAAVSDVLRDINAENMLIEIEDMQALDFVIVARIKTAVQRLRRMEGI